MAASLDRSLVAAAAALLGSLITGALTYAAAARQRDLDRNKRKLERTLRDVAAFHRLEERYIEELAKHGKTAFAWKREIRKQLRDDGFESPSEEATSARAERSLL